MLKLKNSVSIYLMKKNNNGKDLQSLNNTIITALANAFGGCTATDSKGYWVDSETLYHDDNIIARCNYSEWSDDMKQTFLNSIKLEFEKAGQLAVSVELNNQLYILESVDDIKKLKEIL